MKYKLIIDKEAEEEIVVTVRAPSSLTETIENLVYSFSGTDFLIGQKEGEIRKLSFAEIIGSLFVDGLFQLFHKFLLRLLVKIRVNAHNITP